MPHDSIHLLSNYYNFALSKATYRYAVKIDDDQIYFTQQCKNIFDLYRTSEKVEITYKEKLYYAYFRKLQKLCSSQESVLFQLLRHNLPSHFFQTVRRYLEKRIQNDKICISLSGINIFENKITLGQATDGTLPPFNGVHDTIIFPISETTYYVPQYDKPQNRIIEHFHILHKYWGFGFFWLHLKDMKPYIREKKSHLYKDILIEIDSFLDEDFFAFHKKKRYYLAKHMKFLYYFYLKSDMEYIRKELHRIISLLE